MLWQSLMSVEVIAKALGTSLGHLQPNASAPKDGSTYSCMHAAEKSGVWGVFSSALSHYTIVEISTWRLFNAIEIENRTKAWR